jgi:hypothetical protein
LAKSNKDRLKKLVALWHEGRISGLEYSRRATKLTQAKQTISKKVKKKFAKIDRKYNPRPKKIVSGGLPELGKRR